MSWAFLYECSFLIILELAWFSFGVNVCKNEGQTIDVEELNRQSLEGYIPYVAEKKDSINATRVRGLNTLAECVQHCCDSNNCHVVLYDKNKADCWLFVCQNVEQCKGRKTNNSDVVMVSVQENVLTPVSPEATADAGPAALSNQFKLKIDGPTEIDLPRSDASFNVEVLNVEKGTPLDYNWVVTELKGDLSESSSHKKSENDISIRNPEARKMTLYDLREGRFNITAHVSGSSGSGDASVTLKVLKKSKADAIPPVAIIKPSAAVVKEGSKVILVGKESHDSEGHDVKRFIWKVKESPVQWSQELPQTRDVTLPSLLPGAYIFSLTVEDQLGLQDSTDAMINVTKLPDQKPEALAGRCGDVVGDISVRLPIEVVYICGNFSKDDKGIVSYKWTLNTEKNNDGVTADMKGTTTEILEVRELQAGNYVFDLEVTDTADQSNKFSVHLTVDEAVNAPPVANGGGNRTIVLPTRSVVLDGSGSTDDGQIQSYSWTQIGSKPTRAKIVNADKMKSTAIGLEGGVYVFLLNVTDDQGLSSNDTVYVFVNSSNNKPPKAIADNVVVVFPMTNYAVLNGSRSTDDAGIVEFRWEILSLSPAGLEILGNTSKEPVLLISNLHAGTFTFNFTVCDAERSHDFKLVTLTVKQGAVVNDTVEVYLDTDFETFTVSRLEKFKNQLSTLIAASSDLDYEDVSIVLTKVDEDPTSGRVYMLFYATGSKRPTSLAESARSTTSHRSIIQGQKIVDLIRHHMGGSQWVLNYEVNQVNLKYCFNPCSGHGFCDHYTKTCICEKFWMPNVFKAFFAIDGSNCDWSILYFVIVTLLLFSTVTGTIWAMLCAGKRWCKKPKRRRKYKLLDDKRHSSANRRPGAIKLKPKNEQLTSLLVSESADSSSNEETLFDSSKKASSSMRNGSAMPLTTQPSQRGISKARLS